MALGAVEAALVALIGADSGTTALLAARPASFGAGAAIYEEGALLSGVPKPYLVYGLGTAFMFNTFLAAAWNCTVQVKAVTEGTEASGLAIVAALQALLTKGRALTVPGYASSWIEETSVQPTLTTTVAGAVTRELPVIVRVYAT